MLNGPQASSRDLWTSRQNHSRTAAVKTCTELELQLTSEHLRGVQTAPLCQPQTKVRGRWTHTRGDHGNLPQFWMTQPVALTSSFSRFMTHSSFWAPSMNSDKVIWPAGHKNTIHTVNTAFNKHSKKNGSEIMLIRTRPAHLSTWITILMWPPCPCMCLTWGHVTSWSVNLWTIYDQRFVSNQCRFILYFQAQYMLVCRILQMWCFSSCAEVKSYTQGL